MEITTQQSGEVTELIAIGRLDGYWADHLSRALDDLMRAGSDRVCLRMEGIDYVSSLGIRVLVSAYKKFKTVKGSFIIAGPTGNVLTVLEMAGIATLLMTAAAPVAAAAPSDTAAVTAPLPAAPRELLRGAARYEVYALPGAGMNCHSFGTPLNAADRMYTAGDARKLAIDANSVTLGLGAFGADFAECAGRFGEFLAVEGAAACLPADGSNSCDTLLSQGNYVPDMQALYGLRCTGAYSQLVRFEPTAEGDQVTLSELLDLSLELAATSSACVVIAAESAGMIGASLRRSPATKIAGEDPLAFPDVRTWLSFTTEPAHARMSVVACGVVAQPQAVAPALAPYLRPIGAEAGQLAHVHAAAFRFRPLQRGLLQVSQAVLPLFERDTPESVLHLLADDREQGERIESRFTRGAMWIAPLHAITGEQP